MDLLAILDFDAAIYYSNWINFVILVHVYQPTCLSFLEQRTADEPLVPEMTDKALFVLSFNNEEWKLEYGMAVTRWLEWTNAYTRYRDIPENFRLTLDSYSWF